MTALNLKQCPVALGIEEILSCLSVLTSFSLMYSNSESHGWLALICNHVT